MNIKPVTFMPLPGPYIPIPFVPPHMGGDPIPYPLPGPEIPTKKA